MNELDRGALAPEDQDAAGYLAALESGKFVIRCLKSSRFYRGAVMESGDDDA